MRSWWRSLYTRPVTSRLMFLLLVALCIPAVIACGGGDDDNDSADVSSGDEYLLTPGTSASKVDVAKIDVCATLSDADAAAVADQFKLGGGLAGGAKYTVKRTAETYSADSQKIRPKAGCRVEIDAGGAFGAVVIEVQEADGWSLYSGDSAAKKVSGLGDEAVSVRGATVVKVGNIMLSTGENSMTESLVVELYRKMVPGLRSQLK